MAALRLVLVAVVVACLAPFLDKAFHVDDPMYLWAARQIQSHPLDFYGFDVNWYGYATPMAETNLNPPLVSYYLAAVTGAFGFGEVPVHAGMGLLAIALALGIHALAGRLCASPLSAALCAFLTPVTLVSASTAMSDVAMLALWCWAAALFIGGLERPSRARLAASSALMALCPLAKYFGICLVPLLFSYGLLRERRLGSWAIWFALPVACVVLYELFMRSAYGTSPLLDVVTFSAETRGRSSAAAQERALIGLCFLGGGMLTSALHAPLLWSPRALAVWGGALVAAAASIALLPALGEFPLRDVTGPRERAIVQAATFAVAGAHVFALAVLDLRTRRDSDSALLGLWLLGVFLFASFANWTTNGRAVLPAAPAVGILVARALERRSGHGSVDRRLAAMWPLVPGAALALAVTLGDYRLADSARTAARELAERYRPEARKLWFEGTWGFQWYAEASGAERIDARRSSLEPGEIILVPDNNPKLQEFPAWLAVMVEHAEYPVAGPVATLSRALGAGFYTDWWGPLPFAVGAPPPESYFVLRVKQSARAGAQP